MEKVENKTDKNNIIGKRWFWIACILLVVLQYGLCVHYGMKRQYLFCDEVYSYGLANSTDRTFIDPKSDDTAVKDWVTGDYFENYMKYNDESFNYKAAYVNQANDVHPPVYYMMLHTVCYFFKNIGYSAVPGLILNLILLIFVDILLMYVACYLLKNRWYGLIASALWGLSSVGISNCMLIRMYLLQTLNVLLIAAVHIYILKHKRRMTVPYFILLALAVMFGGLTHYYFYFFVAGLGFLVCLYLLYMRQIKQMFAYGFSLVAGLVSAIAIFPATLSHIFGYRGSYATKNIIGMSESKFLYYIKYVNRAYFGGLMPVVLMLILVLLALLILSRFVVIKVKIGRENGALSYSVHTERRDLDSDRSGAFQDKTLIFWALMIADAMLAFVGIQGSELVNARYIYSALPLLAVFVVWCMEKLIPVIASRKTTLITAIVCAVLCVLSIKANGVDWQYSDYPELVPAIEEMKGRDCVIICHGDDSWNNVYAGVNAFSQMGRCRYVYDDDLANLPEYVKDCDDEIYVAVINDPKYKENKIQNMLKKVEKITKYKDHSVAYKYSGVRIYKYVTGE